jgi:hypothetical protein
MTSNHKFIYQEEWNGYKSQNFVGCLTILIMFPLMIILVNVLSLGGPEWLKSSFFFIALPIMAIAAFLRLKLQFVCPRCKKRFRPFWKNSFLDLEHEKCVNCRLPLYYGSDRFYDHWGTERGDALVKEVKEYEKTPSEMK